MIVKMGKRDEILKSLMESSPLIHEDRKEEEFTISEAAKSWKVSYMTAKRRLEEMMAEGRVTRRMATIGRTRGFLYTKKTGDS